MFKLPNSHILFYHPPHLTPLRPHSLPRVGIEPRCLGSLPPTPPHPAPPPALAPSVLPELGMEPRCLGAYQLRVWQGSGHQLVHGRHRAVGQVQGSAGQ